MWRVLPHAQATTAKKVDQHNLPQPEDVDQAVGLISPILSGGDNSVLDAGYALTLLVTDEQGGLLVTVFSFPGFGYFVDSESKIEDQEELRGNKYLTK